MKKRISLLALGLLSIALASCGKTSSSAGSVTPSAGGNPSAQPSEPTPSVEPSVSVKANHLVSYSSGEGFMVALDHEDGLYKEGETVTVTVTIDAEKEFVSFESEDVTVEKTAEEGNTVTGTFVRPDKAVSFSIVVEAKKYKITRIINTAASTFGEMNLKEGDGFAEGANVTLTIQKGSYSFNSYHNYYVTVNETVYHPTLAADSASASVSFVRPKEDVQIVLSYSYSTVSESGYSVTLEDNPYVQLTSYDPAEKYKTFYGGLLRQAGYKVSAIEYKVGADGEWQKSGYSFKIDNLASLYLSGRTGDVTVRVTGEYVGATKISYVNQEAVVPNGTEPLYTEATEGDQYSVNFKASERYTITGKPTITGAIIENEDTDITTQYFKLTVGTQDITISFPAKKNGQITLLDNADIKSCRIVNKTTNKESSYCGANAVFTLYPIAVDGKVVTSARTIDAKGVQSGWTPIEEDAYGTQSVDLRRPDSGDCQVEFNTTDGILVTAAETEHGTRTISNRTTYRAGDKVFFTVQAESAFYKFVKVINNASGEEIQTTLNGSLGYFTRPASSSALTVKAVFAEIEKTTVTLVGYDANTRSNFSASGVTSKASLTPDSPSADFLIGENISIYADKKSDVAGDFKIYKTVNGTETEVVKSFWNYSITVEEGLTQIRVAVINNEPSTTTAFKATIVKPEGLESVTYRVNSKDYVDTLEGALVPGSEGTVTFQIITYNGVDGHSYPAVVTDADGKEVEDTGFLHSTYTIKSDITITFTDKVDD